MKLFNKKISLGMGLAGLFVVSSVVYSLGYKMAMVKFNSVVSSNQEKQKLYGSLSEVDYNIRNEYIGSLDEDKILGGIYKGYVEGIEDENCKIMTREEYNAEIEKRSSDISWDIIDNTIGYLRCGVLGKDSAEMLQERLQYFISENIENIVLDLRNCSHGECEEVFKFLEYVAPKGHLIYHMNKKQEKELACESKSDGVNVKFFVITNEETSGASELLAVALRDFLNAKVVGNQTLGNNTKDKIVEISENLVLKFPNATYVSSKGTDIYKIGVIPDKVIDITESEKESLKKGQLPYSQDAQLQGAISLIKG